MPKKMVFNSVSNTIILNRDVRINVYNQIPKIIHQIWLGGPVPEQEQKQIQSWKTINPKWKHMLWTDKEVANFHIKCRKEFDDAKSMAGKADILRLELLNEFGGFYFDTDTIALKPLDPLIKHKGFLCCNESNLKEYITYVSKWAGELMHKRVDWEVLLGTAALASQPHGSAIGTILEELPRYYKKESHILTKTGPFFLTDLFYRQKLKEVLVLPHTYFYPFTHQHKPAYPCDFKQSYPNSYAVHLWQGSWT